jgi:hypothetical protein
LGYLDACVAARISLETQLKQIFEKDDVTSLLLTTPYNHEAVHEQEMRKYEPIQAKLNANFAEQTKLLETIGRENGRFVGIKTKSEESRRRLDCINQLDQAYETFVELKKNLREGIEFYSNFQDIVNSFRTKCEDFRFAREQQAKDILRLQVAPNRTSTPSIPSAPSSYPSAQSPPFFGYEQPQQPQQLAPGLSRPIGGYGGPVPGAWQPHMAPVYQTAPTQSQSQSQPPQYQYQQPSYQQPGQQPPYYNSAQQYQALPQGQLPYQQPGQQYHTPQGQPPSNQHPSLRQQPSPQSQQVLPPYVFGRPSGK